MNELETGMHYHYIPFLWLVLVLLILIFAHHTDDQEDIFFHPAKVL